MKTSNAGHHPPGDDETSIQVSRMKGKLNPAGWILLFNVSAC
jgi:hypothetical protein